MRQNPEKLLINIWPAGWQIVLDTIEPLYYPFTEKLTLVGFNKEVTKTSLTTKVLWEGSSIFDDKRPDNYYTAYVHLVNKEGERLGGFDRSLTNDPVQQAKRFSSYHEIALPADLPPGSYGLKIGVYYFDNGVLVEVNSLALPDTLIIE